MKILIEKIVPDHTHLYKGQTIEITKDEDPEDSREGCNNGTMCCEHSRYKLGDGGMLKLIKALAEDPKNYLYKVDEGDRVSHLQDTPENWVEAVKIAKLRGYPILPLYLYAHSGLTMSTTPFSCHWDNGQVGVIFCTEAKRKAEKYTHEQALAQLQEEVKTYSQYLQGDIWGYVIKDKDGEEIDSLWGMYGETYALEQAREYIDQLEEDSKEDEDE